MGSNEAGAFLPGPMALLADQWIETYLNYSVIEAGTVSFICETELSTVSKQIKPLSRRGKKSQKETRFYYRNSRALAQLAKNKSMEIGDPEMVAILFRDSDGTASTGRGEWQAKYDSMLNGFFDEEFDNGVAMLPKPKSEAWALCALKNNYQQCATLEDAPGNDRSPNALKAQLETILGEPGGRDVLNRKIVDGEFDISRIDMPSINAFKERLSSVLSSL